MRPHTGHNEDQRFGDRYGMIREPFVIAANEGDVDRRFHAVTPVVYECPEQRAKQSIHGVIVDLNADDGPRESMLTIAVEQHPGRRLWSA